jgi:hypothetical protein
MNNLGSARKLTIALLAYSVSVVSLSAAQNNREQEGPTSNLSFVVLRDSSGKPVRNASVVLHPVNDHGQQSRGGFELKTDGDGKASFDGVPYGKLRVQVLAHGFQTFGEDYDIGKPTTDISIRLKRPTGQYSIYSDQNNTPKDEAKPDQKDKEDPEKKDNQDPEKKPQ